MGNNILALKTYVDGGIGDTPFPSAEGQIEIGSFRYDAKRMGGAPTISMSVYYPSCLDNEWTSKVYAEFNGERFFLKQTPTSSYSNEDARYKHEVELVAERKILDDTYFYDKVVGNPQENDRPVSNDTSFNFYGNIVDFAKRMNASLQYTKLQKINNDESIQGYYVVVDEGITTEDKHISFDGAVFSQALQESYNTFGVPFYFVGKEIHLGFTNNAISGVLEYGVDDALLSITKQNSNFKVVNRASGKGSTENIPYYYPNNSPKGEIEAEVNTTSDDFNVIVEDYDKYSEVVSIDEEIRFVKDRINVDQELQKNTQEEDPQFGKIDIQTIFYTVSNSTGQSKVLKNITLTPHSTLSFSERGYDVEDAQNVYENIYTVNNDIIIDGVIKVFLEGDLVSTEKYLDGLQNPTNIVVPINSGYSEIKIVVSVTVRLPYDPSMILTGSYFSGECYFSVTTEEEEYYWALNDKAIDISKLGLSPIGTPDVGDTITQRLIKHVKTNDNLMPSIYRATDGKERFYNAINYPFDYVEGYELKYAEYLGEDGKVHNDLYKKDDGTYIVFENTYVEGNPKEHVFSVDDLKPTIKGMTNDVSWQDTDENGEVVNVYQRIDMFSEFAYDEGDNDETYTTEDGGVAFKHPYFFAKLRKLDFNLFDHAIENGAMTFSMTSGNCGACNFEIGVSDDDRQFNPVQVDENGNLVRDDEGRVLCGLEDYQGPVQPQPKQQDTINNEVWIALKKEEDTYGILMPKAPKYQGETLVEAGHRPKACSSAQSNDGDTFVIININLPEEYILHAERKLEQKIIQYIGENNKEKFNFSITFSRIFLAENPNFLEQLNENARLTIRYNNAEYLLYVSSFSYNMGENDVLPEIRVELDDTLTISQNALQRAIDSVKSEIGQAINALDVAAIGSRYFLRKDVADVAQEPIGFRKGVFFGDSSDVSMYPDGSAKLTIDYLEVTKKATFTSLEIQEKTHAGGQILVTPAAINCGEVEEFDNYYRCYFQTKGEGGDEIFNQFTVGDQAICQTYNSWESKFYWRFVSSVGENYIDLSKNDCAPESDAPSIGDKIIQLGNRVDETRQNAIVIASYGEGAPYIIQYKRINSFELNDSHIVTKLSSSENIFTGKVHMELGSDGIENLEGGLNIGGQNLLRNSGFTGDYLSEPLADQTVMDATKELYSDPLDHWFSDAYPKNNATVQDSETSASGKELVLSGGSVTQELFQRTVSGETYVLSFKAKGHALTYTLGDTTKRVELTNNWVRYIEKIVVSGSSEIFSITNADCTLCEIQLERGTIATAWGISPLDNSSDRAYYQSMKYLSDSVVNEAMTEGATDVLGGLILTNHIKVGNYADNEMIQETAGVNGKWTSDESVAFWSGGDLEAAITTANKFKDNPSYQPTAQELNSMANFVATHGGRIIANDAVIRGTVYAQDGEFTGKVVATEGEFTGTINANGGEIGRLKINVNPQTKVTTISSYTEECHMGFMESISLTDGNLSASSAYNDTEGVCNSTYNVNIDGAKIQIQKRFKQDSLEDFIYNEEGRSNADISIEHDNGFDGSETAFRVNSGLFEGLRPSIYIADSDVRLGKYDHTIIVETSGITLYLPENPKVGQRYEIFKPYSNSVKINPQGVQVYSSGSYGGNNGYGTNVTTIGDSAFVRAVYIYTGSYWFRTIENYD